MAILVKGKVPGIVGNVDMDLMYEDMIEFKNPIKKTVDELAHEVLQNLWGTGTTRMFLLTEAGYDYRAVQDRVNEILRGK